MTAPLTLNRPRRLALALGVPFALLLIVCGGFQLVGLASQDSFRVQSSVTPQGGKVSVNIGDGDLNVLPGHDGRAHLDGVVTYSIFRPSTGWVTTPSGTVFQGPSCFPLGQVNCGANFDLTVPPGLAVEASSGSGDVGAASTAGALRLHSGSGDVSVERASGPLVLGTGSGDITGKDLSGPSLQANDGSGDVDVSFSRAPMEVKVNAGSGNVTIAVPANVSYAVVASASSGASNIGVPTDSSSQHVIHVSDGSGNISIVPSRR